MEAVSKIQAAQDFSRARKKAFFARIANFMTPDRDNLLSLNDVKEVLKPKGEVYRGMQEVPINLIVGSEGRYRDFNRYFLPRSEHLRERWERVDTARLDDVELPPISLYEIGGVYFVRDGNHRVSVAKAEGIDTLDAEVTSLTTEIRIRPGETIEQLRKAVIAYEKDRFYEETDFGPLTGCFDLDFTQPGRYDVVYNHILVHKYFIDRQNSKETSFRGAVVSWYDNVYAPIIAIIKKENILPAFPGRSKSDLYIFIVKRWDELKAKYGQDASIEEAALDYTHEYGKKNHFG
jgi:hypothetical protein